MEPLTYKKITLLNLCCFFALFLWAAPKEKFEKQISKEFPIAADGKVHLENRYGDINIVTGDFDRVSIDVKIIVNASNQEKADMTFDRINIEFSHTRDYVSAITTIEEAQKSWFSSWSSYSNNGDFQIHYDVQMPQSNALDLKNKYGNTYIDALDAAASVEVKYGNLKMDGVNDQLDLIMGYGNGTVGTTEGLRMEVKYSNISFDQTQVVRAETKYSKITIEGATDVVLETKYDNYTLGKVQAIRNDGKYDHFTIEEVGSIFAESKYTDYKIKYLNKEAKMELEYGGANFYQVGAAFSDIQLEGRYTDYKLRVEEGADYVFEAKSSYAGIRIPRTMQVVHEAEDGREKSVRGYVGNQSAGGKITAELNYGGIKVEEY